MITLIDQFKLKNYKTDKNSIHSYIENVYDQLLSKKRNSTNILEIGVGEGGSILLWRDYFINATIDAVDINDCSKFIDTNRINHIIGDAYTKDFVCDLKNKYDIIIEDGPHTLDSMVFFVKNYLNLLRYDGIAIIEDVKSDTWIDIIKENVPNNFTLDVIDLRDIKGRFDDLVLVVSRCEVGAE